MGPVVLDAYALIAFLRGEQAGADVVGLLRHKPPPSMSAANLAEVVERLVRVDGRSDPYSSCILAARPGGAMTTRWVVARVRPT